MRSAEVEVKVLYDTIWCTPYTIFNKSGVGFCGLPCAFYRLLTVQKCDNIVTGGKGRRRNLEGLMLMLSFRYLSKGLFSMYLCDTTP